MEYRSINWFLLAAPNNQHCFSDILILCHHWAFYLTKLFFNNTGLENIDGYGAEWIKLGLKDDTNLTCMMHLWLKGNYLGPLNVPDGELSGNFECKP